MGVRKVRAGRKKASYDRLRTRMSVNRVSSSGSRGGLGRRPWRYIPRRSRIAGGAWQAAAILAAISALIACACAPRAGRPTLPAPEYEEPSAGGNEGGPP
jgi:hypothetical protein